MGDVRVERHDDMPGCTRCGKVVAIRTSVPVGDDTAELELCLTCDAGAGVAGRLAEHMLLPAEEKSVPLMAELLKAWIWEAMAAQGWQWIPNPKPPREGLLEDERSAAAVSRMVAQRNRRASLN